MPFRPCYRRVECLLDPDLCCSCVPQQPRSAVAPAPLTRPCNTCARACPRPSTLAQLLDRIRDQGGVSYQHFSDPAGLQELVENDLAVLLSERFELTRPGQAAAGDARLAGALPVPATPLLGPPVDRVALWKRREHALPQNTRVRPRPDTGTRFPQPARLERR